MKLTHPLRSVPSMNNLNPKQQRETLLVALYDQVDGTNSGMFEVDLAAKTVGLDPERVIDLAIVLKNSGYIEVLSMGGVGTLSARGISEAERLKDRTADIVAVTLTHAERADLEAFVGALTRAEIEQNLEGDDLAEYEADLKVAQAQANSPRPKRAAVRAVVRRLLEFASQTGANLAAAVIQRAAGL